jgi:hypothetical protein
MLLPPRRHTFDAFRSPAVPLAPAIVVDRAADFFAELEVSSTPT